MSFAALSRIGQGCRRHFGQATVELARVYGLHPVAQPLRLDYMGLKKHLGEVPVVQKKTSAPAFVELIAAHPTTAVERVIEFECSFGGKMRIQWRSSSAPDWAGLLRAWLESER